MRRILLWPTFAIVVLAILATYGVAVWLQYQEQHKTVQRITKIERYIGEQGPPGPKGKPGKTSTRTVTVRVKGKKVVVHVPAKAGVGPQGVEGERGPRGAKGAKGDTGAKGAKGAKGDTGARGRTGRTGARGPAGPSGAPGAPGTSVAEVIAYVCSHVKVALPGLCQ